MQYAAPQDIWSMTREQMKKLQPGQWIYAGEPDHKGVFLGVKSNDVVVVAWYGNAQRRASYRDYIRSLRRFALGI